MPAMFSQSYIPPVPSATLQPTVTPQPATPPRRSLPSLRQTAGCRSPFYLLVLGGILLAAILAFWGLRKGCGG